jgi:mono/diheme cytochrome c family protein
MSEACFRSGLIAVVVFGVLGLQPITGSAQTSVDKEIAGKAEAEEYFRDRVSPFLKTYCIECHQNKRPTEAGVNFSPALKSPGHSAFSELWKKASARVKAHDMPPDYAKKQPAAADRQAFVDWLAKVKFLSPKDPGLFVIRRLTKTEYANTLHDLLGVEPAIASDLPDEVSGAGYLNSLSPLQLEQYLAIANKALDLTVSPDDAKPTEMQRRLFGEPPQPGTDERAAAREVARSLARKAYRRPPSQNELDVLTEVFDLGKQNKLSHSASLRLMLKAILVSPQFLFITPVEATLGEGIVRLDDYQLASRLSYLLCATMPDDQLMALADSRKLSEPPILQAQVKRMLEDPRSRALFDGFGAQWLGLEPFAGKTFDASQFPQMSSELRSAMYDEARLFFESIVRENRSVMSFVDSDYTFLNETLAKTYGLEGTVTGSEMRRVQLSDGNRGGILGMPGVLTATSFPNRTSPVKRGVWVLEQVLGEHVPPPPPDIPALEKQDQKKVANLTLRERTELHRTNAVCANCHQTLDPIGFGLENFDALGRWRDSEENGAVIDASGELPDGQRFSSPKELKAIIAKRRDDFSRNLVERLLAYALCRNLEGYDEIVVDGLMKDIAADEYRMQTLIGAVVTSYPFTHRRIPEAGSKTRTFND